MAANVRLAKIAAIEESEVTAETEATAVIVIAATAVEDEATADTAEAAGIATAATATDARTKRVTGQSWRV